MQERAIIDAWRWIIAATPVAAAAIPSPAAADEAIREIEVGIGYLDEDSFRFGRYSGLTDAGFVPLIDLWLEDRPEWNSGDAGYWQVEGARLGLPSRRLDLRWGQHGVQHLEVSWRELPYYLTETAGTPFRPGQGGVQTLSGDWSVTGDTTGGMPALGQSLGVLHLRQDRRRFELEYTRMLDPGWHAQLEYRYEHRDGRRVAGGMIGSNGGNARAALLPLPVDDRTQQLGIQLARSADDYQVVLSYELSLFEQSQDSLSWENPFGAHPQWAPGSGFPNGRGLLALDPDNRFHQLQLSAGFRLGEASNASLVIARGRSLQDQAFEAYTVNPLLDVDVGLPRDSLDGRIDTTLIDLRVNGRLSPKLYASTTFRLDDRDNRTPISAYRYVPGDSQPQLPAADARLNRPYSYSQQDVRTRLRYRAAGWLHLMAGLGYQEKQRDFSEVDETREAEFSIGARISTGGPLRLSADYIHADRDIDQYVGNRPLLATHPAGAVSGDDFENHPLLRKYYLAARTRDQFRARADLDVGGRVTLGLVGTLSRDDYHDTIFGLQESRVESVNADAAWSASDAVRLSVFYGIDEFTVNQAGRSFTTIVPGQADDPARDWSYDMQDRFYSGGFNIELERMEQRLGEALRRALPGALDLSFEYRHARSSSDIHVAAGPALVVEALPNLSTELDSVGVTADYAIDEATTLRFGFLHEDYRSADFALDGIEPATVAAVLTLGEQSPRYTINWVTLTYRRLF